MKPYRNINGLWKLCRYIDAEYAEEKDTHKSVTGYIVIINGVDIDWHSRRHKTVTLSVTETKWSEITKVCCKILFVHENLF